MARFETASGRNTQNEDTVYEFEYARTNWMLGDDPTGNFWYQCFRRMLPTDHK